MASGKITRKIITSALAPKSIAPYNQAIVVNRMAYLSGILGMDKSTGKLVSGGTAAEARQALTHMQNILSEAGSSLEQVVKTTIFLVNMDDYLEVNEVYGQFFQKNYPARSAVQVAKLPAGAKFEIEAIAITGEVETTT